MEELLRFKAQKQPIIEAMYAELGNTPADGQYFTENNIKTCAADLDMYIDKLAAAQSAEKPQKEINKSIRWVFKQLSTFGGKDEDWEFLWGFMYNGYTEPLTDFILNAAFAAGLKKGRPKTIQIHTVWLNYRPSYRYTPNCTLYLGAGEKGVPLLFNFKTRRFEFNANPYGDSYGMPILNAEVSDDCSTLSFNVLNSAKYQSYVLKAQYGSDKAFIRLFKQLHGTGIQKSEIKITDCAIKLGFEKGMLVDLDTMAYDGEGSIIPLAQAGSGVTITVQEFDAEGKPGSSDNLLPHPPLVDERFVVINFIDEHSFHNITNLLFEGEKLTVQTEDKTFQYGIRTVPVILNAVKSAVEARAPFVSRYA